MDHLTPEQRSRNMAAVRSKDSKPEMLVRRLCFSLGYRYRLHDRRLPGNPDLVFASRRKVIFVHGCFWHQHPRCRRATVPSTRRDFWIAKLAKNRLRDAAAKRRLTRLGWQYLVVWECQTKDVDRLAGKLADFLDPVAAR